jgi:5-formyltetrahydrofolate cyclo-ligase
MSLELRQTIRNQIRQLRRALSEAEQLQAADQLLLRFREFLADHPARCVALYLSFDGEISTQPLINWCWSQHIDVCLPILDPDQPGHLLFMPYTPHSPLTKNRFNIDEPVFIPELVVDKTAIDVIFTPLVAFDQAGHRLGMGGGFYDRTLESWQQQGRPFPVGLAHDCQQLPQIPTDAWDIPLPALLTPSRRWEWAHHA